MSQQIPEAEANETLVATYLVSRHKTIMSQQEQSRLHQNYVTTLSKSVVIESK